MPTLLQIDSSADGDTSRTRALTEAVAAEWIARGEDHTVIRRDVHAEPLPHLRVVAQHWPAHLRGGQTVPAELEDLQREVIDELLAADAVVIGAPMYNYSMPSTLKAWIDLIHVPGVTASFDGSAQPLAGRPAIVVSARGAAYDDDRAGWDHVTPPLVLVLGEGLGMTVHVVTTDRTLAEMIPALDPVEANRQLDAARDAAVALARTV